MSSVTLTELRVICELMILSQNPQLSKPDNLDGKNLKKNCNIPLSFQSMFKGFFAGRTRSLGFKVVLDQAEPNNCFL